MSEDERDRVQWDPGAGTIEITTGGRNVQVGGLADAVLFLAEADDGEVTRALWLNAEQGDILTKMVRYIVDNVKIRPRSKEVLADLLPTLEALFPERGE